MDDGSDTDDGMTPPLPVVTGRGKAYVESQYSQVEKFLPPPASSSSSSAFRPPVPLSNTKPPVQKPKGGSSGKTVVKASQVMLSVDDLRNQSLRALKKLPTGESPTMWTIMTCLDVTDMKSLCKYCGIHPSTKSSKADLGQLVLTSFQKGSFRSLFKPSSDAERRVSKTQQAPTIQESKEQAAQAPQPARSTQLPSAGGQESQRAMPLPTPVMTVGSDAQWRPVDNSLKLLLEQEEDVTRVQDGLYIDRADWKECSSELETIIERNNPSFLAREMLRALGSGRRPVHPRDITLSAAAAAASAMPREKRRFDAVVRRVQECVFPELQSLLTKRMACPQMSVSTQTDGSPSGRGDKTVALTTVMGGSPSHVHQGQGSSTINTSNTVKYPRSGLSALKLIRFDDQKLGLVLSKVLRGPGAREVATIQSICSSVLPLEATSLLRTGDALVSVNGCSVFKMSFSEQLQEIKNGTRPIWLGFASLT